MSLATTEHDQLTVHEVAAMFRVSYMTIYRLVHDGALPAVRVGRSWRISRPALEDYLAAHPGTTAA